MKPLDLELLLSSGALSRAWTSDSKRARVFRALSALARIADDWVLGIRIRRMGARR